MCASFSSPYLSYISNLSYPRSPLPYSPPGCVRELQLALPLLPQLSQLPQLSIAVFPPGRVCELQLAQPQLPQLFLKRWKREFSIPPCEQAPMRMRSWGTAIKKTPSWQALEEALPRPGASQRLPLRRRPTARGGCFADNHTLERAPAPLTSAISATLATPALHCRTPRLVVCASFSSPYLSYSRALF